MESGQSLQAVVLAAGRGTRMRPLSDGTPKPMLPVADRPLVAHAADAAIAAGADELVFVVGYEADAVRSYFGDEYAGVPVQFCRQPDQSGTADAVRCAQNHIDGSFAVLNGDNLYNPRALAALFDAGPAVAAARVDEPSNYGVLSTDGGRVTDIVEKPVDPPTNLANAGAYVLPADALDWLDVPPSERGEHELTDVLDRVIDEFDVTVVEFDGWCDVGRPWELLAANERVLNRMERNIQGSVHDRAELRGAVVVEEGAEVDAGVVVDGPVLIRDGASVGPNAYVRGPALVGENVSIGHAVEIKNSVLMADTTVGHLSYVGDSVLGTDVNFGAGTCIANLRHDDEPVHLTVKGDRVSTGRRKFGVVAGDRTKTAINTSLNAGVTLSTESKTSPGETVVRDR